MMAPPSNRATDALAALVPRSYALASLLGSAGVRIVLYHHIAEHPCQFTDQLGVTTHPDDFAWQLDVYSRDYDVIDLDTALSGDLPSRPLLITFDDAYRSILTRAAPMLQARSMPSVFFLSTSPIEGRELILDNLLCYLSNRVGLATLESSITGQDARTGSLGELIRVVVSSLSYQDRRLLPQELARRFELDLASLYAEAQLYLDEDSVRELTQYGFELANHTHSHVHCRSLSPEDMNAEIATPNRLIQEWTGSSVRAFSYPYGAKEDATPPAVEAIHASGLDSLFLVHARANPRSSRGPTWLRSSIHASNERQLFLQIEVLPRLRNLLRPMKLESAR